jgi:predicted transglutaminase-like cysteine proteinase
MQIDEALQTLNAKFKYKNDTFRWLDYWRIMANDGDKWEGDCEDYSLTLAWLVSDKDILKFLWNLISFRFLIWYVKSPNGEGHAIIKIDGLYYDNIQKKGVEKSILKEKGYKFVYPFVLPLFLIKMILASIFGVFIKRQ